jgi:hypothetical protein
MEFKKQRKEGELNFPPEEWLITDAGGLLAALLSRQVFMWSSS